MRTRVKHVPWRPSAEDRDCGAAAFASVMSHHGCPLSVEEARDLVKTDRSGTSMRWICEGARQLGFAAAGARATYDGLAEVPLPSICHYDDGEGHYVVLTRWSPNSVRVIDPFLGPMRMSRAAFEAEFSGFVVDIRPTSQSVKRPASFTPLATMKPFLVQQSFRLAIAALLGAGTVLLGLVLAGLIGEALDTSLQEGRTSVASLLGKFALAAGVVFLSQLARMRLTVRAGEELEVSLSDDFIERIQNAPVRNFEERCPVAFGGRVAEVQIVREAFTDALVRILSSVVVLLAAIAVLFRVDVALGVALLVVAPGLLAVNYLIVGTGTKAEQGASRSVFRLMTLLVDGFTEFHTIKMFNAQRNEVRELRSRIGTRTKANSAVVYARQLPAVFSQLLSLSAQLGILFVVLRLLSNGNISAGETLTVFAGIGIGIGAVQMIPTEAQRISRGLLSLERIQEIIHMPVEPNLDLPSGSSPVQLDQPWSESGTAIAIDARGVTYGPPGRKILENFSLRVTHGERIAIVGATGSGKTTIARMLSVFDPLTAGTLELFGKDVSSMRPDTVRGLVTTVFQDTRLLQRSLRHNLTLGLDAGAVTDDEIHRVLELCGLGQVIGLQRLGLDTHAARAGRNFSSGQGQRFALARAMLRTSPLLVLDEATANVDSALEAEVLERVFAARQGLTTIVMAHRFATLHFVDRIVVVNEGAVVEQGTLAELSNPGTEFQRLFGPQLDMPWSQQ